VKIIVLLIFFISAVFIYRAWMVSNPSVTYYVDCERGDDMNSGTLKSQAWRSLEKANSAALDPGDTLLFKRGCSWEGTLKAAWVGTAQRPILISSYESGELPIIQNGLEELEDRYYNSVDITGSYQTISYLETTIKNPPYDPNCKNNPIGFFVGFNFRNLTNSPNEGSYNTLQYVKASGHTAGIHLSPITHHNRILRSTLSDNNVMSILTPAAEKSNDDIGAWGILLRGNDHEVAYNYFSNNRALCAYDTPPQGNAIELFEASNNNIHHNISVDDRVFSELGSTKERQSIGNVYAYNLVISSVPDAHFLITRGEGNDFGPVHQTRLNNNTVYFTGEDSEGIVCGAGCNGNLLSAMNNIIWAEKKTVFADEPFAESNNIYWSNDGKPLVQLLRSWISSQSMVIDPEFADPANGNFHLKATSPAIDTGATMSWKKDLDCVSLPQGGIFDIGAYEYQDSMDTTTSMNMLGTGFPFPNIFTQDEPEALFIPPCP